MSRTQIFVPAVGQHDNIGDIILRRQLLDWLRKEGSLHIYVGDSPDGYDEGLHVQAEDHIYRSFLEWYRSALRSAIKRPTAYFFKPGEIQLTLIGMKEHVGMLPLLILIRLRGGQVARIGVGSRNFAPIPRLMMVPSVLLSQITAWRDATTAAYMKRGELMPDLAFGEGPSDLRSERERNLMVVSMRSDRDYPTEAWITGVRTYAQRENLDIVTVTQVLRDEERSEQLAEALGARHFGWDGRGHAGQEGKLRELYSRSTVAVSDRLHVLIAAMTEGATPIGALVDDSDKIGRHFAAAGISSVAFSTVGMSTEAIADNISTRRAARSEGFAALVEARVNLESIHHQIAELVARVDSSTKPAAGAKSVL